LPKKSGGRKKYLFCAKHVKLEGMRTTKEASEFGYFDIKNLPTPISLYETRKIIEAYQHASSEPLIRTDSVFYFSEALAQIKHPARFLKLVSLFTLAKMKRGLV